MAEHKFQGVVGPFLHPGEVIEFSAAGTVATPSVKRQVATAAVVSIATLGTFSGYAVGRGVVCVLTNERLLLFHTNANATKPVANLMGETDRGGLRVTPVGGLLSAKYDVVAPDGSTLRLTFAAIQKRAGRALVEAIAAAPTAPPPAPGAGTAPETPVPTAARPAATKRPAKRTPASIAAPKKAPSAKAVAARIPTKKAPATKKAR